jgi:hypothetical protein
MLRVNPHTNIVFESAATCGRGNIRQIYITISDVDRIAADAAMKRDVERTVDNTVQAVLMGACLKSAPKTPMSK